MQIDNHIETVYQLTKFQVSLLYRKVEFYVVSISCQKYIIFHQRQEGVYKTY